MCLFSKTDLFSQYWFPMEKKQTLRITQFLTEHIGYCADESDIAVQLWRHCLMHTSQPRELVDPVSRITYRWLLQHELPQPIHCVFASSGTHRVLNFGVLNFMRDLKRAAETLVVALPTRSDVLNNWATVTKKLGTIRR